VVVGGRGGGGRTAGGQRPQGGACQAPACAAGRWWHPDRLQRRQPTDSLAGSRPPL
jgi:hypothetical protein